MTSLFKKARDRNSREKSKTSSGSSFHNFNPTNPLDAPSEVAQAVGSYSARRPGEISFSQGDFFYVINSNPSPDGYIEIYDPTKGHKGRAPASLFKTFEKTHQRGSGSNDRVSSNNSVVSPVVQQRINSVSSGTHPHTIPIVPVAHVATLFGVVLYDFRAERSDELSVQTGEKIIICAHHDYEWYIAKFVDKIGEVGLVPVSYVQLIDTLTKIPYKEQPRDVIIKEGLPTIDQWKAIKNKHKASVRPVGEGARKSSSRSSFSKGTPFQYGRLSVSTSNSDIFEISQIYALNANIESFASTNNKFWFLVNVTMSNGVTKSLCRYYEDFFNYHQKLLSAWPREGGKFDGKDRKDRVLPYIPGPVIDVNESLTHKRMIDLNEYLELLLKLPDYISKSTLVTSFFDELEGDQVSSDNVPVKSANSVRPAPALKIINADQQQSLSSNVSHQYQQPINDRYSQSRQDRLSQYEPKRSSMISTKMSELNLSGMNSATDSYRPSSKSSASLLQSSATESPAASNNSTKLKLKFYYKEDIFILNTESNITLEDLKRAVVTKIDEADEPGIESKIKILPKNEENSDKSSYNESQVLNSDSDLWDSPNFVVKGKFLIIV